MHAFLRQLFVSQLSFELCTNYRAQNNPTFKLNFKVFPMLFKRIRALLMWKKPLNHKWTEASLSILLQQFSFFTQRSVVR